jgi:hypothetical protein
MCSRRIEPLTNMRSAGPVIRPGFFLPVTKAIWGAGSRQRLGRFDEQTLCAVRQSCGGGLGLSLCVRGRGSDGARMARNRTDIPVLRHVAARDEHPHERHYIP